MGKVSKDRTWTKLLEAAGSRVVQHPQYEQTLTRRKLIAEMVLTAITNGKIFYLDGSESQIGSKEWVDFVKWLYTHIDGPAPQRMQLSGGGPEDQPIRVEDVTLDNAERLRRVSALFDLARTRAAGQASGNGHSNEVDHNGYT